MRGHGLGVQCIQGVLMLRTYMIIPNLSKYHSHWPLRGSHRREISKQQEGGGDESDR